MKAILQSLLLAVATALTASAQTATLTTQTTNYDAAGGTVTFDVAFSFPGVTPVQLGLDVILPQGWSFASGENPSGGSFIVTPQAGDTGTVSWGFFVFPSDGVTWSFTANYPSGLTGEQSINANQVYKPDSSSSVNNDDLTPVSIDPPPTAPSFVTQPQSQNVDEGSQVSFTVAVDGSPTPTIQWNFNGSPISGADQLSYSIPSASPSDAGDYTATASNGVGNPVTSSAATLSINTAPVISQDPNSASVNQGGNFTLGVVATGTAPLTYQWRKGGQNISGATGASLELTNVQPADAGSYDVVVSNGVGDATSAAATITVVEAPVIGTPPQGSTVAEGTEVIFTVSATGTEPVEYQWFKDGEAISGATDNSYTIESVQVGDAGSYTVEVSNAAGTVTSDAGDLVVLFKPVITTQPQDQTTGANGSVIFSVVAEGNPAELTYQWYETPAGGGSATQVGSSASLELTNLQLSDNGKTYYVDVTNLRGITTSSTATLTVNQGPGFTQQPDGATVTEGANTSLTVAVTGNPTPTLQWQFSFDPVESGDDNVDVLGVTTPDSERVYVDLVGQTGVTLTLNGITRNQRGYYRAVASNSVASGVESAPAFIDVQFRPELTEDLADQSAGVGGTATFNIEGVANPEPTFQWYRNGSPISGATEGEYTTMTLALENNGDTFYAIIDNGIGDPVQTRTATLTVNEQGQVTSQPESDTVLEGEATSFTIEFSGNPTPTIQWFLNGSPIAGANSATYSIAMANRNQAGDYTATVTNEFGSDTSDPATLEVNFAPEITRDLPAQTTANVGATITLNVEGAASPEPRFQWYEKRPDMPSDGGETPAITSPGMENEDGFSPIKEGNDGDLVLENLTLEDSGTMFYVEANNGIGETVRSATTTLLVVAPPAFTTQPAGATIDEGDSYTLTVAASGTPAPSIQWFFNGNAISGATGSSYTISNAVATDGGTYTAVASNAGNQVTSAEAQVVVNSAPTFITQPSGASLFVGERFSASVQATGFQPITYQWQKDGQNIAGATSSVFSIASVGVDDAGAYTVIITNSVGSVTSSAAQLAVSRQLRAPSIVLQPLDTKVRAGNTATLMVEATGNPLPTYQWLFKGVAISGATGPSLVIPNVGEANAGLYQAVASNSQGSITSSTARLTITAADEAPVIVSQPRDKFSEIEGSVTFRVGATGVPEPTYQWRKNGVAISGATGSSLTISDVSAADAGTYSVAVTNSVSSVVSRNASFVVVTRSYQGVYFGSFGEGRGEFAITVKRDNTGTFVGFDAISELYVVGTVTVDDNGSFAFTVTSRSPVAPATSLSRRVIAGQTPVPSAAGNEITINGRIGEGGEVTGTVEGVDGLSMNGNKEEGTESEDVAGFYQASASDTDAVTYTIIAPSGKVIVFTETPEGADAGSGTVDSSGNVNVTTVAQNTVTATVVSNTSTIQAEVTDSTGEKTSFSGGNEDVIATQRLVNISSRAAAGSGEAQTIAGLVITGEDSKPVLIRAVGPGLSEFGVTGVLANPQLDLFSGQEVIASNTGWAGSADAADIIDAANLAGAFALDSANADSAILETLPPGAYTAQVRGADGGSGVVLVEVYDLSSPEIGQKLFNISTRASAGSGNETVVAGFVVSGSVPKRVLLRGVGPTLADYGVNGALTDPQITLFRDATQVAYNNDWNNAVGVANASTAAGAFQLTADSKDAAMVISLDPGVYTLHLSGVGGASGIGLIEVYEIP